MQPVQYWRSVAVLAMKQRDVLSKRVNDLEIDLAVFQENLKPEPPPQPSRQLELPL
jgi:hypothetical protein